MSEKFRNPEHPSGPLSFSESLRHYLDERLENVRRNLPRVAFELRNAGVVRVEAGYDGCGDSGQIEYVRCFGHEGQEIAYPAISVTEHQFADLWYDLLESRCDGWENNDGACGTFVWDLVTGSLEHEHKERFTDYTTSEFHGL